MAVVITGAMSKAFSCLVGRVIPVLIIWLTPTALLIPAIVLLTLLALLLLGCLSVYSGGSSP